MPNSLYSDLCDVYDEGKKPYLFISYSHADTTEVVAAIRALQRLGYRIWYDMGISVGAQWPEDLADHIYGCEAVLAFMTPNTIKSDSCRDELFYARKLKKNILLAYLKDCDLSHGMDMRLGMFQAIERRRCKDDEEFYTLLAKSKIIQPCRGEFEGGDPEGAAEPAPATASHKSKTKLEQLHELANNGDTEAQFELGCAYNQGDGVPRNYKEAAKWFRKSAEKNHKIAQYNLGVFYEFGYGVKPNYEEAVKWYRKAADQKYASALINLGGCYANGWGVKKDMAEAVRLYQNAADLGDSTAQNRLALCYEYGRGVRRDIDKALELYRKSSEQGNRYALYNLGMCYEYSTGVDQDWNKAASLYRKAAELSHANAQKKMVECHRKGLGVPIDEAEAERWQKLYDKNPEK